MANAVGARPINHGGAPWEVRVVGTGRVNVSIVDHDDGTATVRYTAQCSGKHHVYVRLGEEQLAGSPFELDVDVVPVHVDSVIPLIACAQCTLRGLYSRWLRSAGKLGRTHHPRGLYANPTQQQRPSGGGGSGRVKSVREIAREKLVAANGREPTPKELVDAVERMRLKEMQEARARFIALNAEEPKAEELVRFADELKAAAAQKQREMQEAHAAGGVRPKLISNAHALNTLKIREEIAARVAPFLSSCRLRSGFDKLKVCKTEENILQAKSSRVVHQLGMRACARAWRLLMAFSVARQAEEVKMERCVRHLMSYRCACAFGSWLDVRKERHEEEKQQKEMLEHAAVHAGRRGVVLAMWAWKRKRRELGQSVEESKRLHSVATRWVGVMRNRELVAAMQIWHRQLEGETKSERGDRKSHLRPHPAASSLLSRVLISTFLILPSRPSHFAILASARHAALRETTHIRFRLEHKRKWMLGGALRQWHLYRAAVEAASRLLQTADVGCPGVGGPGGRKRVLREALRWWQDWRALRTDTDRRVDEHVRRRSSIELRSAMYAWVLFRSTARKVVWGLSQWRRRRVAAAVRAWRGEAGVITREYRLLTIGLLRLCNRQLLCGFRQWIERSGWLAVLRWAFARLTHQGLSRGWARWHEYATQRMDALRRLRAALIHLYSTHLGPGWRRWVSGCRQAAWLSRRLPWALHDRLINRMLSSALNAWRGRHVHDARYFFSAAKLDFVRRRRDLRHGLRAWLSAIGDPRSIEARLRRQQARKRTLVYSEQERAIAEASALAEATYRQERCILHSS